MRRRPPIKRVWDLALAKVQEEGCCRACGRSDVRLEAAHTLGRDYDEELVCPKCRGTGEGRRTATKCGECRGYGRYIVVNPDDVVPLCGPATSTNTCHGKQHAGKLDLLAHMRGHEQVRAVQVIVNRAVRTGGDNIGIAEAYRRLSPSTYAAEVAGTLAPPVELDDAPDLPYPPTPIPGQTTVDDFITDEHDGVDPPHPEG